MSSNVSDRRLNSKRLLTASLVLAFVAAGILIYWMRLTSRPSELWRSARVASDGKRWDDAIEIAERALKAGPPSLDELTLAGTIALHSGRLTRADELFSQIDDQQHGAADAYRRAGAAWLKSGRVSSAERAFRRSIELDPGNLPARTALAELLRLSGRYFELESLLRELIQSNACPSAVLFAVAWPDKIWLDEEDRSQIAVYRQADPDCEWIGLAVSIADAVSEDARQAALRLAKSVALKSDPASIEGFARWGTVLAESGDWDELSRWNRLQTDKTLAHPQVWYVRGLWQLDRGNHPGAIRCFWEALERGPFHAGATYQLSQLLSRTQDDGHAGVFAERSRKLSELRQQVVFGKGAGAFPDAEVLRKIVTTLEELGRDWEVVGWSQLALARHRGLKWPIPYIEEGRKRLFNHASGITEQHSISRQIPLDHYPLPEFESAPEVSQSRTLSEITFDDVADQYGLRFQYSNGSSVAQPNGFMYEISGGGAGVLDYDLDGWPDIYLSEGGPMLHLLRDPAKSDHLFRNQFGTQVVDVSVLAGIQEVGFGQGVAVGDLNSDGFPDVFVANIGPNQLWLNQGDGTFIEATATAGLSGSVWTMSAVLADVDGDGLTDLYETNYLGNEALSRTCRRDGIVVQCRPTMFPAEPDRLWWNLGDGRLAEAAPSTGIQSRAGKGMGVLAADFEGSGRLSLFITNDLESNQYFRNESGGRGDAVRFVEEAIPLGLAVSTDGSPLASMGIAADDVNQDGRLDLYVTNFVTEGSNLYLQDEFGAFSDRAMSYGIHEKSSPVMGWGAQFLDADLDGWSDLIVANGHLENYERWDVESAMPAQFFRNIEGRSFELVAPEVVGPYFRDRHFGRAVATFDANRDGREDAIVTHVDAPVAWLQNTSRAPGHFLAIQLVGIKSERDAIGARVTLTASGHSWQKQLIAGSGFQASNQRRCVFGVGSVSHIDELRVDWPSGLSQRYSSIDVDREIVVREGDSRWYDLVPAISTAQ